MADPVAFWGRNTRRVLTGVDVVRKEPDCRLYISEFATRFTFRKNQLNAFFTWNNTGLAPICWDRPVMLVMYEKEMDDSSLIDNYDNNL